MDLNPLLHNSIIPSFISVGLLLSFFTYLAIAGSILPGKIVPGVILTDGTRLQYRCNVGYGIAAITDRGLELLSTTFLFSVLMTLLLYVICCESNNQSSSRKPHVTGNFIHDWWFGIQLNPQFLGIDLNWNDGLAPYQSVYSCKFSSRFKFNSVDDPLSDFVCYIFFYYFFYEELMTSTWDIIAERLGFMLVFGDLVWIPFTFSIQAWWLLGNKVELTTAAIIANCPVFLTSYLVFRGANKQKHAFRKNPKAPIWGRPPKVIGGKLLASSYWGIARHSNYLGYLLVALSFSLPCGVSSLIPYFYPIYLLILLIWREKR